MEERMLEPKLTMRTKISELLKREEASVCLSLLFCIVSSYAK
jgi:hypothetical protein